MFDKDKYVTKGIDTNVPKDLLIFLWSLAVEQGKKDKCDYLQVFEVIIKDEDEHNILFSIEHRTEQPALKAKYAVQMTKSEMNLDKLRTKATIFVIDDGVYSTMLFNYEY